VFERCYDDEFPTNFANAYIQIELWLKNGDSEFSQEEAGILNLCFICLIGGIALLGGNAYKFWTQIKPQDREQGPTIILTFSILLEIGSIFF
jgi:hypothetical protein